MRIFIVNYLLSRAVRSVEVLGNRVGQEKGCKKKTLQLNQWPLPSGSEAGWGPPPNLVSVVRHGSDDSMADQESSTGTSDLGNQKSRLRH